MPGNYEIHELWFKTFSSIHDRLAIEMNWYLEEADVPKWKTKGKIILVQKDPQQEREKVTTDPLRACLRCEKY